MNDEAPAEPRKRFWTKPKIIIASILAVLIVYGYACGPETLCLVQGGDPVGNALGAEWCELDGNNIPSDGDFRLNW